MSARTLADLGIPHHDSAAGPVVWRLADVGQVVDVYNGRRDGTLATLGQHTGILNSSIDDSPRRYDFFGGSVGEAIQLAANGWPRGEKLLADAVTRANALALSGAGQLAHDSRADVLPDLVASVAPSARWDLGDYMTGAPDLYREQVPPPSRVIRLILDAAVTCDTTAEQITLAAGALVAVIQRLQAQGVTVSLDVVYGGKGCNSGGRGGLFFIPLLAEGRAMDLDRLAFWLAHPGAFRRFGFALYELGMPQLSGGYGSILELFPAGQEAMQEELAKDPTAILLPPLQRVIFHAYKMRTTEKTPTGQALREWAEAVQGGAA